ncbi:MAG: hypothetical protein ACK526_08855 [Planctomyces sp.]|jgi:hypothetical protein
MSNREAKFLALAWSDNPTLLAEDLTAFMSWLKQNALQSHQDGAGTPDDRTASLRIITNSAAEALQRVVPLSDALSAYRRLVQKPQIDTTVLLPLVESLSAAAEAQLDVAVSVIPDIERHIADFRRWAQIQAQKESDIPLRSEILKTTIEELGDELLVLTDENGSVKLRGTSNIPMFLAFWRARGHRLGPEAFLDIDRNVRKTNLDRHRTRLCALLQRVLLEIVADGNGLKLQKCRE